MINKHSKFKETYGLKWNTGSINLLGVHITDSMSDNYKYNFEPKLKKIKSLLIDYP